MNLPSRGLMVATLVSFALVVGCTSDSNDRASVTVATTTTTTVLEPQVGDGELVIGALVPITDTLIGQPLLNGVELGIRRINASGGVLDSSVRLVVADEGGGNASTAASIQTLLDEGVDAIVGPASSLAALNNLARIVSAEVVACSPTASALALDEFPDDGLFFRTIPSDTLQAQAIAQVTDQTGARRVAIAHVDDAYGRSFADAVQSSLEAVGVTVSTSEPFPSDTDSVAEQAQRVADSDAQVAIVLGDQAGGTRFLEALDEQDTSGLSTVVVNDAMRNPSAPQRLQALSSSLRTRIVGLAPQAESSDPEQPFDPDGPFAANAYDCTNLIALAAASAGSDAPRDIAGQLAQASESGSVCTSFEVCSAAIDNGLQIDYNGPSGVTDISSRTGDPSRAVFDQFVFDDEGRDVPDRTITVGS